MDLHKLTIGSTVDLDGHRLDVTDDPITLELVDKGIMIARLSIYVSNGDLEVDDAVTQTDRVTLLKYFRQS